MPNHTLNVLTVTGPAEDVEAFRVKVDPNINPDLEKPSENNPEWLDFNGSVPMPKELKGTPSPAHTPEEKKTEAILAKKYGAGNWYDWHIENWGTKWGAYSQEELEKTTDGGLIYRFGTAWFTPSKWVESTAKVFPTLKFEVDYKNEDSDNFENYEYSYQKAHKLVHQKNYKKFLNEITSPEFPKEIKYRDFDKDVLKRIHKKDLPLLINFPWDNLEEYTQHLTNTTMKEG